MIRIFLVVSIVWLGSAQAEIINVQKLNENLKAQNSTWFAKANHLTGLEKSEVQRRMGLRLDTGREVEFVNPAAKTFSNLPSKLDWRNKGGRNWVSPILDQGNCGSCVAFAAVGVLETQYKISSLLPNFNIKLSPQHLFSCGGGYCDYGWYPDAAASFIQKQGVPDEACAPYISGATGEDIACRASCVDSSQRAVKISGYTAPTRGTDDVELVKAALQRGPVVTTLSVYADFMAYGGGVYKHTKGEYLGGHAISIIGYDDEKRAYIIRNSWGKEWGEDGFGYVSYDDSSGVGGRTWLYEVPALVGGVSVESPSDYSYFTKNIPVTAESSFANTANLMVSIYGESEHLAASLMCEKARCAGENMDISALKDGRYEVVVSALNARGEVIGTSTKHFFYVANTAPKMAISFSGKDTDLNQSLKGRVEFNISTSSSSVPLSTLIFYRKGPSGKIEKRSTQVVPSELLMGWRTNIGENGTYEIWFEGHVQSNGFDAVTESPRMTVKVMN